MNGKLKNYLLLSAVVLLILVPLLIIKTPATDPHGMKTEIFTGADTQAEGVIQKLNPDYRPWFESLIKPPSSEIETLLFALQAALGAGAIGYYVGYMRGKRSKINAPDVVDRAH